MMNIRIGSLVLLFALARTVFAGDTATNRIVSSGFLSGGQIYFLAETRIVKPGRIFRFIGTFRFPERILDRSVSLYALDIRAGKLRHLGVLEAKPAKTYSVRYSVFSRKNNMLAVGVAEKVKDPDRQGSALVIYLYNLRGGAVSPVPQKEEQEAFRLYFSDVTLPFDTGPGIIPARKLDEDYLASIPSDTWPDRP